jgi:hypothetical protein
MKVEYKLRDYNWDDYQKGEDRVIVQRPGLDHGQVTIIIGDVGARVNASELIDAVNACVLY